MPVPPIVVFPDAPPRTKAAVDDLALYIEKVTGSRPEILSGDAKALPARAIWIGYQPALKKLFPGLDFDFKFPEEILIAANQNHLVIAGRDRWDPAHLAAPGVYRVDTIDGVQQEYGTANAIYTFLQKYLNVMWLWPGASGEDIIPQTNITFPAFEYRYHPQFLARSCLFRLSALGDKRGHSQDWVRFQRLQLDSLAVEGGHGFVDWWPRFHASHPEYFALQPDGSRSAYPKPTQSKQCLATPAVWDQWVDDVAAKWEKNPLQTVFNATPNDSWASGICVCDNCVAWDNPNGKKFTFYWKGLEKEGPALSDRYVTFWNHLTERLQQRFPDRKFYITGQAYGNTRPAPLTAVPNDHFITVGIFNLFFLEERYKPEIRQDFVDWSKLAPIILRPNLWVEAGAIGLPELSLKETMENFRFAADHNCIGFFFDTTWENWATTGPQYYLMAQLAWNPDEDGRKIMDEYYRRGFGKAAPEIKEYWDNVQAKCEEITRKIPTNTVRGRVVFFKNLDLVLQQFYTDKYLARLEELLQKAREKVADEPEIYRQRVDFVQAGLSFTKLMLENLKFMQQVARSGGNNPEALAQAEAAWQKLQPLFRQYPEGFYPASYARNLQRNFKSVNVFSYLKAGPTVAIPGEREDMD